MTLINRAFGKRVIPVTTMGGTLSQPPKATMEQFIRAYGEIGWFHAVVSFIARGVAEIDWKLNRLEDGDPVEITGPHRIKALLNEPNPFMTGHDLMDLTQTYEDITGEAYWHLDSNKGKDELWPLPPHKVKVVISDTEYITGYVWMSGMQELPIPVEDMISFISPNPLTPWRGISPAQAIGIELDTQTYANQTNRFYFYNGATMGLIIAYPSDVSEEEYTRLKEQFNAEHRGYGRAHRVTILSGGPTGAPTVSQAGQSFGTRDMDFVNMLKNGRDAILGAYGIPYSQLGGAEVNTRATAEAAQVDVARRVLRPRLFKKKETLNRSLVPKFIIKETPQNAYRLQKALRDSYGYWTVDADKRVYETKARLNIETSLTDNPEAMKEVWKAVGETTKLQLDFDNPVPKDVVQNANVAGSLYQQGVATKNEAREMVDLEPVDDGDDFYTAPVPASPFGGFGDDKDGKDEEDKTQEDEDTETEEDDTDEDEEQNKGIKKKSVDPLFPSESTKDAQWREWIKQAESFNPKFTTAMQGVFDKAKKEALAKCKSGINRDSKLIDLNLFKEEFIRAISPVMAEAMLNAIQQSYSLIKSTGVPQVINQFGLKWLKTRIEWAATEVGEETQELLRDVLVSGFEQGENPAMIARRIVLIPGFADTSRANKIARTEILAGHNIGTIEGYKETGRVKQVQVWASLDDRRCPLCSTLHGQIHGLNEGYVPPFHPNCRCCLLPVVE